MSNSNETQNDSDPAEVTGDAPYVIVGVDGSEGSQRAIDWAINHSDTFGPVQPVAAYHVEALGDGVGTPSIYHDLTELMAEDARNQLTTSLEPYAPEVLDRGRVVRGYPGPALVRSSQDQALLVVGSRGRSALAETLLGSVTSYCVKHASIPVAVIPEGTPVDQPLNHLVVGIDGSKNADAALRWALQHVAPGGTVTAINTWVPGPYSVDLLPSYPEPTAEEKRRLQASIDQAVLDVSRSAHPGSTAVKLDVTVNFESAIGDPRVVLPERAGSADLLVIGARGHRGITYLLLGSVSTSLLHHPTVPTVVVPES
ncbi:MAG: universal stress protein [Acidimicrobiales bacterium]